MGAGSVELKVVGSARVNPVLCNPDQILHPGVGVGTVLGCLTLGQLLARKLMRGGREWVQPVT